MTDRRRLSDLIVPALELAIEQERLASAEHLLRALEESLTAFGGVDAVERRDVTDEVVALFDGWTRSAGRSTPPDRNARRGPVAIPDFDR
jgi:hypothetical protein